MIDMCEFYRGERLTFAKYTRSSARFFRRRIEIARKNFGTIPKQIYHVQE